MLMVRYKTELMTTFIQVRADSISNPITEKIHENDFKFRSKSNEPFGMLNVKNIMLVDRPMFYLTLV